jgi:hypothetical protein
LDGKVNPPDSSTPFLEAVRKYSGQSAGGSAPGK